MMNSEFEVLLVEDTRSDAEMTIRAIKKTSIAGSVLHLKDGREAMDFLFGEGTFEGRDVSQKPKVILLDLKMPRVTGFELLKRIKEDQRTKSIPVVVLTSSRESPDIEGSYALGANSYIVKPVASADFMTVVSTLGLYWVSQNQTP